MLGKKFHQYTDEQKGGLRKRRIDYDFLKEK
jgi:hypothetical protein